MLIRKLIPLVLLSLFVVSCSGDGDEGKDLKLYVASFLNGNSDAAVFGSLNVKQFLDKTGYEGNDKLKVLIGTEVDKVNSVMNIDQPLYYVVEGPFAEDGSPSAVHLFMKVKNKDSLIMELNDRSFDVTEKKEYAYTEDGDFVLGITNDLAIATIQRGDYDANEVVKANIEAVAKEEVKGKSMDILNAEGDIVIGLNLENLYASSNTDLNKLGKDRQKEIQTMVADSYLMSVFKFSKGEATLDISHLFSDALKKEMFFRMDPSNPIFSKINKGEGVVLGAMALNVDVAKMESFMSRYAPDALDEITGKLGMGGSVLGMLGGDSPLSKISNGQIGIAAFGNQMENSFGINSYYGTNNSGKMLIAMLQDQLPPGQYDYREDGVYGNFDMTMGPAGAKSSLKLPKGCENFSKDGFTFFLSLQDIDVEEFGFEDGMKALEIVDYATFSYGNDGGKLLIKAKGADENILKQAMDLVLDNLMDNIAGMAI